MKFSISHEFPLSPEQFWKNLFDPAYDAYIEKDLEFRERKILEFVDDGKEVRRRIYHLPKRTWPVIVDKVLGNAFGFTEESRWVRGTNRMDWRTIPNRFQERVRAEGYLGVTDLGGARVRRVVEGEIEVRMFGVGGLIEKAVHEAIEESYVRAAASLQRWIEEHPVK